MSQNKKGLDRIRWQDIGMQFTVKLDKLSADCADYLQSEER